MAYFIKVTGRMSDTARETDPAYELIELLINADHVAWVAPSHRDRSTLIVVMDTPNEDEGTDVLYIPQEHVAEFKRSLMLAHQQ